MRYEISVPMPPSGNVTRILGPDGLTPEDAALRLRAQLGYGETWSEVVLTHDGSGITSGFHYRRNGGELGKHYTMRPVV